MSHGKILNLITKDFFKLTLGQIWSLKKYLFGNLFSWESVKPWWHFQTKAYTREHIWENNKNTQIYRCCQESFPSQIFSFANINQLIFNIINTKLSNVLAKLCNITNTEYQENLPLQISLLLLEWTLHAATVPGQKEKGSQRWSGVYCLIL